VYSEGRNWLRGHTADVTEDDILRFHENVKPIIVGYRAEYAAGTTEVRAPVEFPGMQQGEDHCRDCIR
jgi:hypothetical protein